ncbi:hypothetical protein D3C71_1818320 [compost metagenome]
MALYQMPQMLRSRLFEVSQSSIEKNGLYNEEILEPLNSVLLALLKIRQKVLILQ